MKFITYCHVFVLHKDCAEMVFAGTLLPFFPSQTRLNWFLKRPLTAQKKGHEGKRQKKAGVIRFNLRCSFWCVVKCKPHLAALPKHTFIHLCASYSTGYKSAWKDLYEF